MCSCNKNGGIKTLNGAKKSFGGGQVSVDGQQKKVKKTREELLAELRRRISSATR